MKTKIEKKRIYKAAFARLRRAREIIEEINEAHHKVATKKAA